MSADNLTPWDANFFRRKTMRPSHDQESVGPMRFFEIYSQSAAGAVSVFRAELLKNVSFSPTTGALLATPTGEFAFVGDPNGAAHSIGEIVRAVKIGANWWIGSSGMAETCNTVRFQISVADPTTRTALCAVAATMNGCTPAQLPDTVFIANGYFIEVCDPGGCFFNEPDSALVGREGWASYMLPIQGSNNCSLGPYYLSPEWEVFSLCCAIDSCLL